MTSAAHERIRQLARCWLIAGTGVL